MAFVVLYFQVIPLRVLVLGCTITRKKTCRKSNTYFYLRAFILAFMEARRNLQKLIRLVAFEFFRENQIKQKMQKM